MHKYCSPTRSSIQSGRLPYHVNVLNDDMSIWNPQDPVAGFAGIPRNMTTIAMHLKTAGYSTHMRVHASPSTRSPRRRNSPQPYRLAAHAPLTHPSYSTPGPESGTPHVP